jgi:hypothetical protein
MDSFDYIDERETKPRSRSGMIWNILTIATLLGVVCIAAVFLLFFINPYTSLNPYPPPTLLPTISYPTPTNTPRVQFEPTWTPTINVPRPTVTERPTSTPFLTETPIGLPSATPGPTLTPGGFAFIPQAGSPVAIPGAGFHPEAGCNWMGVGGQVTNLNGEPLVNLYIQLGGTLEGQLYEIKTTLTGTAQQYGDGGFEFTIADRTIASQGTLWVQIVDQQFLPLSDKLYFDTYSECEKNLIIIFFNQVK